MLAPRVRGLSTLVGVGLLALLAACGSSTEPRVAPADLVLISGSGQFGTLGGPLSQPLVVKVKGTAGAPLAGVTVSFVVTAGSATVSPASVKTDATGEAQTQLTLGSQSGQVEVTATIEGTSLTQKFIATALAPAAPCTATSALSLTVGQVVPAVAATSVCVSGGTAGAEFALVPFYGTPTASATTSLQFLGTGINPVASSLPSLAPPASPSADLIDAGVPAAPLQTRDASFDLQLRMAERRDLAPLIPAARAYQQSLATSPLLRRNAIPSNVTVGQLLQLNTSSSTCASPRIRTGRVAAITQKAIVVADTGNPAGGFTDADYQSVGVTFDTLIDPMDRKNFGDPTDIDGNGKILIFYTRAVNELTPRNSSSYVGGFFFARDLFPTTKTAQFDACPGSNYGEMFYLLAPDPAGVVNGNVFTKGRVDTITIGTVAHEYQHLINASRRMYVNTDSPDFEEVWLNEGLSHVAEELLFYAAGGAQPRMDLTSTIIRGTERLRTAYNTYARDNTGRYSLFLKATSSSSPYADNDSLETRGATWSFLRYAADHATRTGTVSALTPDGDFWFRLVNTTALGLQNLGQVLGGDPMPAIRDWATSIVADDIAGVDARYQQPSWNYKQLFLGLGTTYPLVTISLSSGSPMTVTLDGGSSAYLRFGVSAGQVGSVQWNTPAAGMAVTLVRVR